MPVALPPQRRFYMSGLLSFFEHRSTQTCSGLIIIAVQ